MFSVRFITFYCTLLLCFELGCTPGKVAISCLLVSFRCNNLTSILPRFFIETEYIETEYCGLEGTGLYVMQYHLQ